MSNTTITVQSTVSTVREIIRSLSHSAQAGGPTADNMMRDCGNALLGQIRRAFIAKSKGGTDEAGESWEPLKPSTIAARLKERKRVTPSSRPLTQKQHHQWWDRYRQGLSMFGGDKRSAERYAWSTNKKRDTSTSRDSCGHGQVDILRDTSELLESLSPDSGSPDQVMRVSPGEIEVGTDREAAIFHHRGVPGRLPQRRLWPEPKNWPDSWWRDIAQAAANGVVNLLTQLLR